jgi:hypothetical protein
METLKMLYDKAKTAVCYLYNKLLDLLGLKKEKDKKDKGKGKRRK